MGMVKSSVDGIAGGRNERMRVRVVLEIDFPNELAGGQGRAILVVGSLTHEVERLPGHVSGSGGGRNDRGRRGRGGGHRQHGRVAGGSRRMDW